MLAQLELQWSHNMDHSGNEYRFWFQYQSVLTLIITSIIKSHNEQPQQRSRSHQPHNMVHRTQPASGCFNSMNDECYVAIIPFGINIEMFTAAWIIRQFPAITWMLLWSLSCLSRRTTVAFFKGCPRMNKRSNALLMS